MAESPSEEDLAIARTLLAERSAENLAAVLVRFRRDLLPAPEVLEDPGTYHRDPWSKSGKKRPSPKQGWFDRGKNKKNKKKGPGYKGHAKAKGRY